MSLAEYRASSEEQKRTADLLALMPGSGKVALDIGARDGHFSHLLAQRFDKVIALDLELPQVEHPKIECIAGNAAQLDFPDSSIDFVFCAEVLEHIPPHQLTRVCKEIGRVARGKILIGVPYKQDTRVGRTTCVHCGHKNPPWGHVNSFDERRLSALFPEHKIDQVSFVGSTHEQTNALSCVLMDMAGNPYGTYMQQEPCIFCEKKLISPPARNVVQKVLTKLAFWSRSFTGLTHREHANWIHILFTPQ